MIQKFSVFSHSERKEETVNIIFIPDIIMGQLNLKTLKTRIYYLSRRISQETLNFRSHLQIDCERRMDRESRQSVFAHDEKGNRAKAIAVLQEILDVWRESVLINSASVDAQFPNGFEIRMKCNLDDNSRNNIGAILEKHKLCLKEKNGLLILSSQLP